MTAVSSLTNTLSEPLAHGDRSSDLPLQCKGSEAPRFIHIQHVPTASWDTPYCPDNADHERAIASQFKVIQIIEKYRNCPVLVQSLTQNLVFYNFNIGDVMAVRKAFPNRTIPSSMKDLNYFQKRCIYNYNATDVMLFLQKIPTLYKTISQNTYDIIKNQKGATSVEQDQSIIDEAMACAKEVLQSSVCTNQDPPTVLVVFQPSFNFDSSCKKMGLSCETIDAVLDMSSYTDRPRFVHVMQIHRTPFDHSLYSCDEPLHEEVVESQLKVMHAIQQYADCPVLAEGLCRTLDLTSTDFEAGTITNVKEAFSSGIPKYFRLLNPSQKKAIYDHGACNLMLMLGQIPTLFRTTNPSPDIANMSDLLALSHEQLFDEREVETVGCAKEALSKHQARRNPPTVLVVFGAAHSFKARCQEFEYSAIDALPFARRQRYGTVADSGF